MWACKGSFLVPQKIFSAEPVTINQQFAKSYEALSKQCGFYNFSAYPPQSQPLVKSHIYLLSRLSGYHCPLRHLISSASSFYEPKT